MKQILVALIVLFTMASCNQAKIGYADTGKITKEYKAVKDLQQELDGKTKLLKEKYDKLEADFQSQVAAYQKRGHQDAKKEQELQMMYQQIGGGYQAEVKALEKENQERLEALAEDIKTYTEDFAKSKGLSMILGVDGQSLDLIYGDKSLDVTNDLIDSLNKEYKSGQGKKPEPVVEDTKSEPTEPNKEAPKEDKSAKEESAKK